MAAAATPNGLASEESNQLETAGGLSRGAAGSAAAQGAGGKNLSPQTEKRSSADDPLRSFQHFASALIDGTRHAAASYARFRTASGALIAERRWAA